MTLILRQNETDTWSWMSYNFEIEYADGRVDEFEVKADTNADHSQFTGHAMEGQLDRR